MPYKILYRYQYVCISPIDLHVYPSVWLFYIFKLDSGSGSFCTSYKLLYLCNRKDHNILGVTKNFCYFSSLITFYYIHEVEVSWYIGAFARLSRRGPGFESHHRRGTFVLQQGNLSTLLLSTQVYKWGPGRRWQIIVFEFASAIIGCYTGKECSQGSGNCAL